jgi:hypothetical protein
MTNDDLNVVTLLILTVVIHYEGLRMMSGGLAAGAAT